MECQYRIVKRKLSIIHAPTNLSLIEGSNQVTLTWDSVSGAISYSLYYQTGTTVNKATATKITDVISPYTLTGLTNDVEYAFAIVAVLTTRESKLSNIVTGTPFQTYSQRILAASPTFYWPLNDLSGPNASESVSGFTIPYSTSGITYGVTGIGDGLTGLTFDGLNSHVLIGNVGFNVYWDGNTGSAITWVKIDSLARWDDITTSRWLFHIRAADATYYVAFGKINTLAKRLSWRRRSGGVITEVVVDNFTSTDWFCMGITWSLAAGIRCFLNGAFVGTSSTGITDWLVNNVDGGQTVLYAGSNTLQEWIGSGGRTSYWKGVALSDATMISLTAL